MHLFYIVPRSHKCLYRFDSFYMQNGEKGEPDCKKHTNSNCFFNKIIQNYTRMCGRRGFSEKSDEKVIKRNGSYIVKKDNLK